MKNNTFRRSLIAFFTLASFATSAWALTSGKGTADRIIIRPGYAQYHYWGGGRCPGAAAPATLQVDRMLNAHVNGHSLSLDYNNVVTAAYGTSRCWDGGTMVW
jgi:hypothetical protein